VEGGQGLAPESQSAQGEEPRAGVVRTALQQRLSQVIQQAEELLFGDIHTRFPRLAQHEGAVSARPQHGFPPARPVGQAAFGGLHGQQPVNACADGPRRVTRLPAREGGQRRGSMHQDPGQQAGGGLFSAPIGILEQVADRFAQRHQAGVGHVNRHRAAAGQKLRVD